MVLVGFGGFGGFWLGLVVLVIFWLGLVVLVVLVWFGGFGFGWVWWFWWFWFGLVVLVLVGFGGFGFGWFGVLLLLVVWLRMLKTEWCFCSFWKRNKIWFGISADQKIHNYKKSPTKRFKTKDKKANCLDSTPAKPHKTNKNHPFPNLP